MINGQLKYFRLRERDAGLKRWLADVDAGPASEENSPPAERPEE